MSFRLRVFLLVLVVAVSAIGATAWLTLSLATRQVERDQASLDRHELEIVDAITDFGIRHGRWAGVDRLVAELSERTGLHIQITPTSGEPWLADSDNLRGLAAGPVESVPKAVRAAPEPARGLGPVAVAGRSTPVIPADLFAPMPPGLTGTQQMMIQVVQYRAALVAVRCMGDAGLGEANAIASVTAPYLSDAQRRGRPDCVDRGVAKVRADTWWLDYVWDILGTCRKICGTGVFTEAALAASGLTEVEIYLGAGRDLDVGALSRPAVVGGAGLVLVAALGAAWLARRVSRPVGRLTMASLLLAGGERTARVPVAGRDELARLSASFNTMAEAVQRSEERQRRLVADVAHELRTPLSNLRGYLEGLSDGVVEPSRELFASLHEETLLQRRILDDLQVLALAETGDLRYTLVPADLAELAAAAVTAHRAVAADAGVTLSVDAPHRVPVTVDPDRMRQVLGNLLSNAIRYTDPGGQVVVRVRPGAELTVRDTGAGMSGHDLARIFDRFYRADPARQRATGGSGLGLTITRRIVTDHGGTITATSVPGEGSAFTVSLPSTAAPRR